MRGKLEGEAENDNWYFWHPVPDGPTDYIGQNPANPVPQPVLDYYLDYPDPYDPLVQDPPRPPVTDWQETIDPEALELTSSTWAGTRAFGGSIWDTVKLWDNSEVAENYRNLRAEGRGIISSAYNAFGANVGERIGVGTLNSAYQGRNAAGERLSMTGRALYAVGGTAEVTLNAIGLKGAPRAISGAYRAASRGLSAGFARLGAWRTLDDTAKAVAQTTDEAVTKVADDLAKSGDDALKQADEFAKPQKVEVPATANELPVVFQLKCFAPETPVATPTGFRPIAEIATGDVVYAYDFSTGEWVPRCVSEKHDNVYDGPVLTVTTERGSIRTTVYHPFWVWDGRDLAERSTPRELAANEDQGKSLVGRWVNSHELRVGDVLIGQNGEKRTVLRIEQEYQARFRVNNLTIDEHHTFAVGADGILVHNTTICDLFPNGFLGRTQKQVLEKAPKEWKKVSVNSGNGWKLVDEKGIERVRFMRPDPNGRFAHQQSGYWRLKDEAGNFLDEFGDIIDPIADNFNNLTHIPYSGLR